MNKQRLLELAGIPLVEGPPKTTKENPLVVIWDSAESKDYPESGLAGHMHLTTAQNIYQFKVDGLADQLWEAGEGKRVKAGKVWLEMSEWTKKEIKHGGQAQAVAAEKKDLKEERDFISSGVNAEIDQLVEKLAKALYKEAVSLAGEVYDDEGAGKSPAKTREEYIKYATKRFLSTEYKKSIMGNLVADYNDLLE
jgi:hypothetical protein